MFLVTELPSSVIAPEHPVHPPLLVCGPFCGSAARFHSTTLRLQFRVAPIITRLTGSAISSGPSPRPAVTDCSVRYRFFFGYASWTSVSTLDSPPYKWKAVPSTYLLAAGSSRIDSGYDGTSGL